jgi:hypothetical protein
VLVKYMYICEYIYIYVYMLNRVCPSPRNYGQLKEDNAIDKNVIEGDKLLRGVLH